MDEAPGSRFVDFDVNGPLNNPKSNLYNRVLGDPVKGFFHESPLAQARKFPKDKSSRHHDGHATPPTVPDGTGT